MSTQSIGFAVIAGRSADIGAVYADRLARRAYDLLLVARKRDDPAKKLGPGRGLKLEILVANLIDSKEFGRTQTNPSRSLHGQPASERRLCVASLHDY